MQLYSDLIDALANNQPVSAATIIGPAELPDGFAGRRVQLRTGGKRVGTLGSAALDDRALAKAVALAASTPSAKREQWQLTAEECDELGLPAGTTLDLFLEVAKPAESFLIVGAGHVALPVAQLAKLLGFVVTVIDDRPEFANRQRFPEVDHIIVGPYDQELARMQLGPESYVVLVTRGHVQDEDALRQVINLPLAYLGMIGSKRRVRGVIERVQAMGSTPEAAARVFSPIGLDIGAETPEEIAVSILAEVINVRRRGERHPASLSVGR